jgi:hypothetical protein
MTGTEIPRMDLEAKVTPSTLNTTGSVANLRTSTFDTYYSTNKRACCP